VVKGGAAQEYKSVIVLVYLYMRSNYRAYDQFLGLDACIPPTNTHRDNQSYERRPIIIARTSV
jgi:hypothetical protein